jgi:hypothetical protein
VTSDENRKYRREYRPVPVPVLYAVGCTVHSTVPVLEYRVRTWLLVAIYLQQQIFKSLIFIFRVLPFRRDEDELVNS